MKYKYCPWCGGQLKPKDKTSYQCQSCQKFYWNNPRGAVSVLLVKNGKLLFAKRGILPRKGAYDLPGGFMEYDEDPFAAAIREVQEETSLKVKSLQLITADTHMYTDQTSTLDLVMLATEWQGEPLAADDVASLEWGDPSIMNTPQFAWPYGKIYNQLKTVIQSATPTP